MEFKSPKNFKRGSLIANRFRWRDLFVGIGGVTITISLILIYITLLNGNNLILTLIFLLPAIIAISLILPASIYHNLGTFLIVFIYYLKRNKNYIWEGVYKYEIDEQKEE